MADKALPRLASRLFAAALLCAGSAAGALAQKPPATSNFASVGFDVATSDHDAFQAAMLDLATGCAPFRLDEDNIVCLREKDNGGQVWIGLRQVGRTYEFVTANPGFVGKSAFAVRVMGLERAPSREPFENRLAVQFSDDDIPLLIELADPREAARFRDLAQPVELVLDVTAFGFQPEIFENEKAFAKAQEKLDEDAGYAPDFFIPSGLLGDRTSSRATFGGEILEAQRVTSRDGASYWRTLVRVQGGGTLNVVFDDIWPDLEPQPGQLISGAFWLSAQVPSAR
jgi:hypothetical protein